MNEQAWFCRRQPLINICITCWYICILMLVPTASFWRSIMKREWKLSGVCRIQSHSKSNAICYHYVFTSQNDDNPIQFILVFHKGYLQLGIPSWGMKYGNIGMHDPIVSQCVEKTISTSEEEKILEGKIEISSSHTLVDTLHPYKNHCWKSIHDGQYWCMILMMFMFMMYSW